MSVCVINREDHSLFIFFRSFNVHFNMLAALKNYLLEPTSLGESSNPSAPQLVGTFPFDQQGGLPWNKHTHSLGRMSERGEALSVRQRETVAIGSASYYFGVLPFCANSISEEIAGFSPLCFPRGKYLCLLSLVIFVVHIILSDKILRSYCLNDKNITWYQS